MEDENDSEDYLALAGMYVKFLSNQAHFMLK